MELKALIYIEKNFKKRILVLLKENLSTFSVINCLEKSVDQSNASKFRYKIAGRTF